MTALYPRLPIKRFAQCMLGKMLQPSDSGGDLRAPYLRAANVQPDGELRLADRKEMWFSRGELDALDLLRGDVVVVEGGIGGFGRAAHVDDDLAGWGFQNSIIRLRPRGGADGRYLAYALLSERASGYIAAYCNIVSMPHFTAEKVAALTVPSPPIDVQRAVADFLDEQTSRIDALIAKQTQLIDTLRERRRAVISHAMTFGIRDVEMLGTGNARIPLMPEDWVMGPVKSFLRSLDGRRVPLSGEQRSTRRGDYPYYGASGVIDGVDGYLFDEPLVLVSEDGANLVRRSTPIAFESRGKVWVNNHAHVLVPRDATDARYWAWRIDALDIFDLVTGSAQPKLTADALMNLRLTTPASAPERNELVSSLEERTSKIDTLIARAEEFIGLARERRAALITAAVTGQIDVRTAGRAASVGA